MPRFGVAGCDCCHTTMCLVRHHTRPWETPLQSPQSETPCQPSLALNPSNTGPVVSRTTNLNLMSRQFGDGVIDYTEIVGTSLSTPDRLALFKCARVLVLTAVREVMVWVLLLQLAWPCECAAMLLLFLLSLFRMMWCGGVGGGSDGNAVTCCSI